MIEIFLIGAIILFVFFYTGKINTGKFVADYKDLFDLLKEDDYEFLLYAKYGDSVYDPDAVFVKRLRDAFLVTVACLFIFISEISFLNIVIFILGRILGILLLIGLLYWLVYLIILAIYPLLPKKFKKKMGSPYGPTPWWLW